MTTKSPSGALESDSDWSRFVWKPGDLIPLSEKDNGDTEGNAVRNATTKAPGGKKRSGVLRPAGTTTLSQQIGEDEDGEE